MTAPNNGASGSQLQNSSIITTHHSSLDTSPFKALYGQEPNLGGLPNISANLPDSKDKELEWAQHIDRLRTQLARAQNRCKQKADRHRTERMFNVGEQVLLKVQPYAQSTVANRPCPKLAYKFFGPFPVEQRIGTMAYRITLPPDSRIHNVFHVSQLKPFTPDYTPVFSELPKTSDLTAATLGSYPGAPHGQERERLHRASPCTVVIPLGGVCNLGRLYSSVATLPYGTDLGGRRFRSRGGNCHTCYCIAVD